MHTRKFGLILAAASLLVWGLPGCDKTALLSRDVETGYEITISPMEIVKLGFLQDQEFTIHLVDSANGPVTGEPVEISLLGSANNARVSPDTIDTNSGGTATVTLTAPDKESNFTVRFVTPRLGYSASVDVQVSPELLGLSIDLDNQGVRGGVINYQAILFEKIDCDSAADTDFSHAFASQQVDLSEVPGRIRFDGLRAKQWYTVLVQGRNDKGQVRISGCLDQLAPNQENVAISLYDTILVLAGQYAVSTEIKPDGALDESADTMSSALKSSLFFTDTGKAILDTIRALLVEVDPFAGPAFDKIRSDNSLDAVIAQYLSDNQISVASSFETIWATIMAYLGEAHLTSELDIAGPEGDEYTIAHRLTGLTFTDGENPVELTADLFLETMLGVAGFEGTNKDILTIGSHSLAFGLGVAVKYIFGQTLSTNFGTDTVAGALVSVVDCEQIGDALLPMLSTVTNRAAIVSGCAQAANDVDKLLESTLDTLSSRYPRLIIEGSCTIHDPGDSSHIDGFEGDFMLTWTNLTSEPIKCPFTGTLIEQ